jgi:opacity protein-like surface antigen
VEADIYHLNPGLAAQSKVATSPTAGDFVVTTKSGDINMTIFALEGVGSFRLLPDPAVPEGRLQLYAGAGLAVFVTSVDSEGGTSNATLDVRDRDTSVGPQVKVGARWFFTRNLGAFLEGRYAHTRLHVEDSGVTNLGAPIKLKLSTSVDLPLVLVGLSWHFR